MGSRKSERPAGRSGVSRPAVSPLATRAAALGRRRRPEGWRGRLEDRAPLRDVPPGVPYTGVLRTAEGAGLVGLGGVGVAVVAFLTFTPLLTMALVGLFWLVAGGGASFAETYAALLRYEHPWGMVAAQLGVALLLPISIAMVRLLHRVDVGYLFSVRPGVRWRALAAFFVVAVVTMNAVLWIMNALAGKPFVFSPQPGFAGFLLAILITCPLQAAAEEIFFRGYLLQALGSLSPYRWVGIVASAFVFAVFHGAQNGWLFASRFAFGVLAAVLVVYVGGLEAGIAAHITNNVFAFLYAGLSTGIPALKAIREVTPLDALGEIVMYAVFTAVALLVARALRLETRTPGAPADLAATDAVR